ncbi:MAG TPA: DinB family protein [Actinomycetes bacterium]|nr:DinB family protein [Actinomycetes bacterium]
MEVDWGRLLAGQLEFYWDVHLRPRLEGLGDEEYFWEPVEGCWSLRRAGDGRWRLDQGPERAGDADAAVAFLERSYRSWHDGVAGLDEQGLRRPLGPRGGPYADDSMAELVVHISREVMHHGAEIALLRDLYRATGATSRDSRLVPRP